MSLLKENGSLAMEDPDTHSVTLARFGRKRRRSSILKQQRPFTDVQNLSRDDSRLSKERRVSFCHTITVKEFDSHNPAGPLTGGSGRGTRAHSGNGDVKQVALPSLDEPHMIQMSTPVKRKKRRISVSQVGRLSIIPKLDKSFSFFPEDDFVICEEDDEHPATSPAATAPRDEITLLEELPDPNIGGVDNDVMMDFELNPIKAHPQSFPELSPSFLPCPLQLKPIIAPTPFCAPTDSEERETELLPLQSEPVIATEPSSVLTEDKEREIELLPLQSESVITTEPSSLPPDYDGRDSLPTQSKGTTVSAVPPNSSPIFKHPKRLIHSQLKLKSSAGKVVKPSPIVRKPGVTSVRTPHFARPTHTTFTITPQHRATGNLYTQRPPTSSPPPPSSPPSHQSPPIPRSSPPSHQSPPPPPSPLHPHSIVAVIDGDTEAVHSLLASPLLTDPATMMTAPSQVAWLQSSPGDSYSLLHSGDETSNNTHHPYSSTAHLQQVGETSNPTVESVSSTSQNTPLETMVNIPIPSQMIPRTPIPSQTIPRTPAPSQTTRHPPAPPQMTHHIPVPPQMTHRIPAPSQMTHHIPAPPQMTHHIPAPPQMTHHIPAPSQTIPHTPIPSQTTRHPLATSQTTRYMPAPSQTTRHPLTTSQTTRYMPAPSQTTRLATALQRLHVSGTHMNGALPVSIETPEIALIDVPPPPAVPSDSLHMSPLQVTLNNTTLCGRSMLLSPSIYDKFVTQICSEGPRPTEPPETTQGDPNSSPCSPSPVSPLETQPGGLNASPCSPHTNSPPVPNPSLVSAESASATPTSFNCFLSEVTSRLQDMLSGVHHRLSCEGYTSAHQCLPLVLDKWSRVLAACLGTLTVLQQYGDISGVSSIVRWNKEGVPPELPLAPLGQEDVEGGLARKAEWILELIASYNLLLPTAHIARDQAAMLYGWHFEEWSHDTNTHHVTVSVDEKHHQFQISVSDIVTDRLNATKGIAQSIWNHTFPTLPSTPYTISYTTY